MRSGPVVAATATAVAVVGSLAIAPLSIAVGATADPGRDIALVDTAPMADIMAGPRRLALLTAGWPRGPLVRPAGSSVAVKLTVRPKKAAARITVSRRAAGAGWKVIKRAGASATVRLAVPAEPGAAFDYRLVSSSAKPRYVTTRMSILTVRAAGAPADDSPTAEPPPADPPAAEPPTDPPPSETPRTGGVFDGPGSESEYPVSGLGDAAEYGFMDTGRWRPCNAPITWSFDPGPLSSVGGSSATEEQVLRGAFASIARQTGYTFHQVPSGGAITITGVAGLPGDVIGEGGATSVNVATDTYLTGAVRLDLQQLAPVPWRARMAVYAHEIGHVFALDHTPTGTRQTMYPVLSDENMAWGAGDIAAWRSLPKASAC